MKWVVSVWDYALNTRSKLHPVLRIATWETKKPFKYAVTLECTISGETTAIARFDNKNNRYGHHLDLFFKDGPDSKHNPSPVPPINSTHDLPFIFEFIDKNWGEFVKSYDRCKPTNALASAIRSGGVKI